MSTTLLLARNSGRVANPIDPLLQFLPPGMTFASDISFDSFLSNGNSEGGWVLSVGPPTSVPMGGIDTPVYQRISDGSGGYGPYIGRINFRDNTPSGNGWPQFSYATGAAGFTYTALPANSVMEMYFAIRFRFSGGYVVHSDGSANAYQEKFWYPTFTNVIGQRPPIQLGGSSTGEPPFKLGIYYQDDSNIQRVRPVAVNMQRNTFYTLIIHQRLNTLGTGIDNADGFVRLWLDGELVEDFQDCRLANMQGGSFAQAYFALPFVSTTRGGGLSAGLPAPFGGMWRDHDRMVLYYKVQP